MKKVIVVLYPLVLLLLVLQHYNFDASESGENMLLNFQMTDQHQIQEYFDNADMVLEGYELNLLSAKKALTINTRTPSSNSYKRTEGDPGQGYTIHTSTPDSLQVETGVIEAPTGR